MNEINITIKNEESIYKERHLDYKGIRLSHEDEDLQQIIDKAVYKFKLTCSNYNEDDIDIIIKQKMIWK